MLVTLLALLSDEQDRRALFALYSQYQNTMLRVAQRFFPDDPASAEDAVQGAWLWVVEHFSRIFEIPCKKRGVYLAIIVKNQSLTLLRKRRELPLDESLAEGSAEIDDGASVLDVIRAMPETYRAALEMRFVEGRTTGEIAAALGLSEGAVNTRISRGRALLAERLRREGYTL